MVGCAVRTENKMQAIDAWCAWRTLQTSPYMNTVILRINQSFLQLKNITTLPALLWKINPGIGLCFLRISE
jgi:hypothetical protein